MMQLTAAEIARADAELDACMNVPLMEVPQIVRSGISMELPISEAQFQAHFGATVNEFTNTQLNSIPNSFSNLISSGSLQTASLVRAAGLNFWFEPESWALDGIRRAADAPGTAAPVVSGVPPVQGAPLTTDRPASLYFGGPAQEAYDLVASAYMLSFVSGKENVIGPIPLRDCQAPWGNTIHKGTGSSLKPVTREIRRVNNQMLALGLPDRFWAQNTITLPDETSIPAQPPLVERTFGGPDKTGVGCGGFCEIPGPGMLFLPNQVFQFYLLEDTGGAVYRQALHDLLTFAGFINPSPENTDLIVGGATQGFSGSTNFIGGRIGWAMKLWVQELTPACTNRYFTRFGAFLRQTAYAGVTLPSNVSAPPHWK